MWAVVGLGNPGKSYSHTRHNVGFLFVKKLAREWDVKLRKRAFLSKTAVVQRANEKVILAMPQTYMNRSGYAVKEIVASSDVRPEHLLVVYDDLDILLGEIRIRKEGSAGSHKGMISIIQEIRTEQFPRIRMGIGPLAEDREASEFVLSPFRKEEQSLLEENLAKAWNALEMILAGEIDKAMNTYNQKVKTN